MSGNDDLAAKTVYQRIEERLAAPMRQVAALERATIAATHGAQAPKPREGTIPFRPGVGRIASLPTPPVRKG